MARVQQLPGWEMKYGPDMASQAFGALASGLEGFAQKKQMEQRQLAGAFPAMVSTGMARPWAEESEGSQVQFGGMPWEVGRPDETSYGVDERMKLMREELLRRKITDEYGFSDQDTINRMMRYVGSFLQGPGGDRFMGYMERDPKKANEILDQIIGQAQYAVTRTETAAVGKTRIQGGEPKPAAGVDTDIVNAIRKQKEAYKKQNLPDSEAKARIRARLMQGLDDPNDLDKYEAYI